MKMDGGAPITLSDVFCDFKGRRAGIIKALTSQKEEFYQKCDPDNENLCLYGLPNESWEVHLPDDQVPPEIPEPALGINFPRNEMEDKDWLSLVAAHSDTWLISVAFYFGARFGFGKNERKRLFQMINDLPTVFEIVTAKQAKQQEQPPLSWNKCSGRMRPRVAESSAANDVEEIIEVVDPEDEERSNICGVCEEFYVPDEFWICCDICEIWYHGKCVKITQAKADKIKLYKCPSCSSKRARV